MKSTIFTQVGEMGFHNSTNYSVNSFDCDWQIILNNIWNLLVYFATKTVILPHDHWLPVQKTFWLHWSHPLKLS